MQITLLYFGRPSESLKLSQETVQLPAGVATLAELLAWLRLRGDNWAAELTESRVRCAINQEFSAWTGMRLRCFHPSPVADNGRLDTVRRF